MEESSPILPYAAYNGHYHQHRLTRGERPPPAAADLPTRPGRAGSQLQRGVCPRAHARIVAPGRAWGRQRSSTSDAPTCRPAAAPTGPRGQQAGRTRCRDGAVDGVQDRELRPPQVGTPASAMKTGLAQVVQRSGTQAAMGREMGRFARRGGGMIGNDRPRERSFADNGGGVRYWVYVRRVGEIPESGIMDAWFTTGPGCRRASWLCFLNSIDDNKRESLPARLRT